MGNALGTSPESTKEGSFMTPQEIAERGLILKATVGSTVHGLALPGHDDTDEMGICIEPPERVVGLQNFEQYIFRTAEMRERHEPTDDQRYRGKTPPSQPGDTDLVIYSLRKYVRLATAGNPTVLILLFAPPNFSTPAGDVLQERAELFASRQAGMRFLGYLAAQRERLLGTRGQMRVTRTELIEKFGYDTKFAMHAVRLGFQGREYLETGRLTLPMNDVERAYCRKIREGRASFVEVIEAIEQLEVDLKKLLDTSPLPRMPDREAIDRLVTGLYLDAWDTGRVA
jgi:predicted nucleotidyltransferase